MKVVEFPQKLMFLFKPAPAKVAYGGRMGVKSWSFSTALLELGAAKKMRILCARETMESIGDSVHKLLSDTIERLHLDHCYTVQQNTILGKNGTQFIFKGLKHNIDNIKSLEAADIVWVEEAQTVSKDSWDKLIPTIARKDGAEIWVSFNPELATDDTYKRWVLNPPPGTIVQKTGWEDNRWLSERALVEIRHLKDTRPKDFEHIYGGDCVSEIEGAIYGAEMKTALDDKRICVVPYNRARPVDTVWDLGFGDLTAIWFIQAYDNYYHFIDYLEGEGRTIADYLVDLQSKQYLYGTDWLPHDGVDTIIHHKLAGTGDRSMSVEMLMRNAGRKVRITPKMFIADGINAARTIFPQCRFDEQRCADGLMALRHYQWDTRDAKSEEIDKRAEVPSMRVKKGRIPLHNWASHASDAFRGAAVAVKQPKAEPPKADQSQIVRPPRLPGNYAPFS